MVKTKLRKYIKSREDISPITSDKEIRFRETPDGDELVWCGDPAGDNPDVVIEAKRGEIISVMVNGRRIQ